MNVLRNNRYLVQREGEHEGARSTSTAADHMKWWNVGVSDVSESNDDEHIGGQMWWSGMAECSIMRKKAWLDIDQNSVVCPSVVST